MWRAGSVTRVPGLGSIINAATILLGGALGVLVGHRLPERARITVTDALGLTTLVIGALNVVAITDQPFRDAVGSDWTLLVVLGALLIGGISGSVLRIEYRLEHLGGWLQLRLARRGTAATGHDEHRARERFIQGFVTMSLLACIGPLAILGSLSDGLGNGIDQLVLKAALDGFAALAFASTLGWGVAASAIPVAIYQGALTAAGVGLGSFMPDALVSSMTATGGVLLLGVGFRLLNVKSVAVGDLLPALVAAPLITAAVSSFVG